MKDTLIMFTHSKRVLYVHEFYLVISLVDFTVSLQHAGANDTQVFQILFRGKLVDNGMFHRYVASQRV